MSTTFDSGHEIEKALVAGGSERRDFLKAAGMGVAALGALSLSGGVAFAAGSQRAPDAPAGADNFYQSSKVTIQKVTFNNQYRMQVVGNLVTPKGLDRNSRAPTVIVGHPMGAVKEQASMLYAQKLAEQGFVTLAIDLSFWGESQGQPRNLVAPDLFTEAFSAAVDYLGTQDFIVQRRFLPSKVQAM